MRLAIALAAASAQVFAAGAAGAAPSVEVKDAVARVTVIPEPTRQDIKVEVVSANPQLPLTVRSFGGRTIVDGGLGRRIRGCSGSGDGVRVQVRGLGEVAWAQIPQIVIRTPKDVNIDNGGAVWGSVGRSSTLKLGNAGCGDWVVGNVEGPMRISLAGSGNTRAGASGEAKLRVAGSGDTVVGPVRGGVTVDIAGSGDVRVASVNGPLDVHTAGSGDVKIDGGHATTMAASIAGSGRVDFRGDADSLKARIAGSGDVHADQVRGEISKAVMGSGRVTIGH